MRFKYRLRLLLLVSVLIATYLGGYCALLLPDVYIAESAGGVGLGYREPNFRICGPFFKTIYLPITTIDKWCRPKYWTNYSTTEGVLNSNEYSWGRINFVDGRATSLWLYANTNKDVENAFDTLRQNHEIYYVRIVDLGFNDMHLRKLQDIRKFDFVDLLGTSVTKEAVQKFRRSNPKTEVTYIVGINHPSEMN